jgi:hypothetical protein
MAKLKQRSGGVRLCREIASACPAPAFLGRANPMIMTATAGLPPVAYALCLTPFHPGSMIGLRLAFIDSMLVSRSPFLVAVCRPRLAC